MYTIGIAGGTCSGKTTLTAHLRELFEADGYKAEVLHMDAFFKNPTPKITAPFTGIEYPEHNAPESFRLEEFYDAIEVKQNSDADKLIIEGLLLLWLEPIR